MITMIVLKSVSSGLFFVLIYYFWHKMSNRFKNESTKKIALFLLILFISALCAYWFISIRSDFIAGSIKNPIMVWIIYSTLEIFTEYATFIMSLVSFPTLFFVDHSSRFWINFDTFLLKFVNPILNAVVVTLVYHFKTKKQ